MVNRQKPQIVTFYNDIKFNYIDTDISISDDISVSNDFYYTDELFDENHKVVISLWNHIKNKTISIAIIDELLLKYNYEEKKQIINVKMNTISILHMLVSFSTPCVIQHVINLGAMIHALTDSNSSVLEGLFHNSNQGVLHVIINNGFNRYHKDKCMNTTLHTFIQYSSQKRIYPSLYYYKELFHYFEHVLFHKNNSNDMVYDLINKDHHNPHRLVLLHMIDHYRF